MKIIVLGATGMAGSAIVHEAARRGRQVIAASRRPQPTAAAGVTPLAVDLTDPQNVFPGALANADALVLSIRLPPGEEDRLAPLTGLVLDRARDAGVRVLVVGGAAPLRSPDHPGLLVLDDPRWVPAQWRDIAAASLAQYEACVGHAHADWIYVSPSAVFEPGEVTGSYRRGGQTLLVNADGTSRITPPDFALAVLDELEHPGHARHITVIEGSSR